MLKFAKLLIGLLLVPLCHAVTVFFLRLFDAGHDWDHLSRTTQWFMGGFVIWLLLFLLLPKPVRTYVLAHELTHALWGLLMGARVSRLRVTGKGGSVTLSKSNFLITLAPYFFPFYSILALAAYLLIQLRWDMSTYLPFWYALYGLTWAFHLTFTVQMLGIRQPDIHEHGRIFSYAVIYSVNLLTAAFLLNLLTNKPVSGFHLAVWSEIVSVYGRYWDILYPWIGVLSARW